MKQLKEKMIYLTQEELYEQLTQPLLHNFPLSNEELFRQLREYFVCVFRSDGVVESYGFLATKQRIVTPPLSNEKAENCTVYIRNRLTDQFKGHKFNGLFYNTRSEAVELMVSVPALIFCYLQNENTILR